MTQKKAAAKPLKKQYETFEEKRNLGSRETFVKAAVWNPRLGIHSFAFHSFAQNRSPYRATVSELHSLVFSFLLEVNCTFTLKKRVIRSKKFIVFTMFLTVFHCFPRFYAQEKITHVALLSVSLFKERYSDSLYSKSKSLFRSFAHKNERFARRTKERIPNPVET